MKVTRMEQRLCQECKWYSEQILLIGVWGYCKWVEEDLPPDFVAVKGWCRGFEELVIDE